MAISRFEHADEARAAGLPEPEGAEHPTVSINQPRPDATGPATVLPAGRRDRKRLTLTLAAGVLVLAAIAGAGATYVYSRRLPAPAAGKPPCARGPVSRALVAANPQLKSFSWRLVSYTCQNGWAAARIYAPSVGHGEAFLLRATSGWISDPINGGIYHCSDLSAAFVTPIPPQELAEQLFRKVGLCRTQ
jgi:hypothetical protein